MKEERKMYGIYDNPMVAPTAHIIGEVKNMGKHNTTCQKNRQKRRVKKR